jgi:Immunity protein family (Imm11)
MSGYFIIKGLAEEETAVLYSLASPSDVDGWMLARSFSVPVAQPVEATLVPDNEDGLLLPFYGVPQIMHRDVREALLSAGVDNVDFYQAVVKREDGTVVSDEYFAYNILGAVRAADLVKTSFAPEYPSRMIDSSIEKLSVDPALAHGLLMFRLAESIRTVVVHQKVRAAIEAKAIPHIVFLDSSDWVF